MIGSPLVLLTQSEVRKTFKNGANMTPLPPLPQSTFIFLFLKNFSGCLYNSLKVHHIWINLGEGGGSRISDFRLGWCRNGHPNS